jgi:hypothetical protein
MSQSENDEITPLLADTRRDEAIETAKGLEDPPSYNESNAPSIHDKPAILKALHRTAGHVRHYKTLYIIAFFILIVDIPGLVGETAELAMLQIAVCRGYYSKVNATVVAEWQGDIPERLCHVAPVQSELAKVKGIRQTLYYGIGTLFRPSR